MRAKGFTLIETLVVMAIVTVLSGLTISLVARAKFSGHVASCAANLSQIGHAMELYAQDHEELWPPQTVFWLAGDHDLQAKWVMEAVHPYTKSDEIFHCPLNQKGVATSYEENLSMIALGDINQAPHLSFAFRPSSVQNPSGCLSWSDLAQPSDPEVRTSREVTSHGDSRNGLFVDGHVESMRLYAGDTWNPKGTCEGTHPVRHRPRR